MSSDVVEETMAYDAFEAAIRARDASDDASTTRSAADEDANARLVKSRRALARSGALADVADAYGAYVSLMRSGLWRDIAPRRASEDEGGYIYLLCDPTATPKERRKDTPRKARTRTVAVPFAVTRACATPAMFDVLAHARAPEPWPWPRVKTETDADEIDRLLIMIDSDGTTTSCRLASGFIPPADVPEKTGEGDSDSDSDGGGGGGATIGPTTTAKPRAALACSDGESDEELLEDDRALTLAERHARPESEPESDAGADPGKNP